MCARSWAANVTFKLGQATTQDIPGIAQLWHSGWHEAHAAIVPAELTKRRTPGCFTDRTGAHLAGTRIGHLNDTIAGFCMIEGNEVYQLYVAQSAQGSGLAAQLLNDAKSIIRNAGHSTAWLACSVGNSRAERFYEKSGWTNTGVKEIEVETSKGPYPLPILRFETTLL